MATASKKKNSAKVASKPAARSAASSKKTSYQAASSAARAASSKPASAAASSAYKPTAELYQFPFTQAEMQAATEKAAASMQSTMDQMMQGLTQGMKQCWDMAQAKNSAHSFASQDPMAMFKGSFDPSSFTKMASSMGAQMPQFDMSQFQNHFGDFAKMPAEVTEQFQRCATDSQRAATDLAAILRDTVTTVSEVSGIAVTLSKEIGSEILHYGNKTFTQNVEMGKQVLTCRTLNDLFDLSTRIAKANLDAFFSESVKLSEMMFQCATEVSEPLNEHLSDSTERLSKTLAA